MQSDGKILNHKRDWGKYIPKVKTNQKLTIYEYIYHQQSNYPLTNNHLLRNPP